MKTIGLIGGMSWESTATYYRIINKVIHERLGGLNSARIIIHSFNFEIIGRLLKANQWNEIGEELAGVGKTLENAGSDFLVIATNTMHKVAGIVEEATSIPLLHIADPTAEIISAKGLNKVGLIGTSITMEDEFYRKRLYEKCSVEVLIPRKEDRQIAHSIIFDELCQGIINDDSKGKYKTIIEDLGEQGAEGIVLGCTEISMLISQRDTGLPLFDTTQLHAQRAAEMSLQ